MLRGLVKALVRGCANVAISPLLVCHALEVPILGKDRALEGSTQLLALFPGLCGQYCRRAFLAWTIRHCHPSATICFGTIFSKTDAWLGENIYIGPFCSLGSVRVERDTLIATRVEIPSGSRMHGIADLTKPIREQPGVWELVTIGENCWIGSASVIMADIGRDSVIGAGSVVTKPIPPSVIAAGVPAKVLKTRAEAAKEQEA